jgi:hypothetical protein
MVYLTKMWVCELILCNGRMSYGWQIGKQVEGSDHSPIKALLWNFSGGTKENREEDIG